jgi:hypothetical protein
MSMKADWRRGIHRSTGREFTRIRNDLKIRAGF